MLEGQLEAEEPNEDTHPEDPCPGARADTEKTDVAAKVPREDSNAQEMPVSSFWNVREGSCSYQHALEPAFGKISPLSADEEKKPKYTGGKSQSATLLGQRSSSNNLAPPKVTLRAYHLQRINSGQTPPQEDGDKNTSGRHPDSSATRTGRPTPWAERRG
uniref:Uncharacterized protein n=1 Tax=Cebus imitator TaxID=2715852 RepID=A0A2K5PVS8_CEBIM